MNYKPLIVVDDDYQQVRDLFQLKAVKANVDVVAFASWDKTKEYLEANINVDAIVLDARGQLNADKDPSDVHLLDSLGYVKNKILPYAIYTAYTDSLPILEGERAAGRVFTKGIHKEEQIFDFLKNEIANSPKLRIINQYPEPFRCFGGKYLEKRYENLLLNVIQVLGNDQLSIPEDLLFNPCRIILEQVFKKVSDTDNRILPYALLQFEKQRAGLTNCYKHLSGIPYYLGNDRKTPINFLKDSGFELISKQLDLIISVCHPGSHYIQPKYSPYTFKLVLWALFDVLIWLKNFIEERD